MNDTMKVHAISVYPFSIAAERRIQDHQLSHVFIMVATTPPKPPSPILAKTKKLRAIKPNPTAVNVVASTPSTKSTLTFCSSSLEASDDAIKVRSTSSSENPRASSFLFCSSSPTA
eukprot:CAMPEP_0194046450 /NCGR_PEP_ID=MMETSP0009_2-20130614/21117_1 /TAXON_ID=210454 /ORGANISM="Grammatophora oceanica, Strain CCMP 410" /LENGTH=115 /DNA_ID=CAMNT_0038691745 /DNA_START=162 /DNA_END=509 /DNA_ORIENTATION=+